MAIETNLESIQTDIPADMMMTTAWMDPATMEMIGNIGIAINLLSFVLYLLFGWGLYMINKKLGEKHAWMSWIPLLQLYSLSTASGKPFMKYIVWPTVYIIIFYVLSILITIWSLTGVLWNLESFAGIGIAVWWFLFIALYINFIIKYIQVLHGISLRTGRGVWTTIGFLFISFIMFPVVGYKLANNVKEKVKL